jgi:hypothetical protein
MGVFENRRFLRKSEKKLFSQKNPKFSNHFFLGHILTRTIGPYLGVFLVSLVIFIDFLIDYTHRILIFNNIDRREFFCVNFCVNEA